MRTVKRNTLTVNKQKRKALDNLCHAYNSEKQYWLEQFRSWEYQALLGRSRTLRDAKVQQKYKSPYGLQARHWKLCLEDAAETWDKYWQALFVTVRSKISSRKTWSEVELHYAYWLINRYPTFASMMQGNYPKPPFDIEIALQKRVINYVKKTIRENQGKAPTVKKSRSLSFDANCYEVFMHNKCQYIRLMSLTPGKRIIIPLSGKAAISGTITLVLSKESVTVHVSQEIKKKKDLKGPLEAVDLGYTEVMTDTAGIRYGTGLGKILTEATEKRHKKMQRRHKLYALMKKKSPKQAKKIKKYNLGKKKQHDTMQRFESTVEREINSAIHDLIRTKEPSVLVTEDLRHAFSFNHSSQVNRKFSSWVKGTLQDRIAFKALTEGFRLSQVNSAYGSQSCPFCEFVDSNNRKGDRFQCLHCKHEDSSDRIAAMNYARRVDDPEIGRYTPYREVKTILLNKFYRRLETGQPVTIPGLTLDTVVEECPPSLSRLHIIAGREKSHMPDGKQRAKQNKMSTF